VASLALELAGMAAMMRAEAPRPIPRVATIAEILTPAVATLPARAGDVRRFLLACLPRAKGEQVILGAIYARYRRWRDESQATALPATAFAEEFKGICERVALRTRQNGSKVYVRDVRLLA